MTIFLTFVDYTLLMKVKLIECTHELDLQDEINDFLKLGYNTDALLCCNVFFI